MECTRSSDLDTMFVNIDFEKACDRLEWPLLPHKLTPLLKVPKMGASLVELGGWPLSPHQLSSALKARVNGILTKGGFPMGY
jgi:hypothetical protein